MEEIIAEGIHLIEKPAKCIVEDGCLSLKGRKLAALETEEIKLTFRPKKKGKFVFKPKFSIWIKLANTSFVSLNS